MNRLFKILGLCLNEFTGMILIVSVVAMVLSGIVQWFVLFYGDWETSKTVATWVSAVISAIFFIISIYLISYGKSSIHVLAPFFYTSLMFVTSMAFMVFFNYGLYQLVEFYKTGVIPDKTYFWVWLAISGGSPFGFVLIENVRLFVQLLLKTKRRQVRLRISHDAELPLYITELKFINSKNNFSSDFDVEKFEIKEYDRDSDTEKLDIIQKNQRLNQRILSEAVEIPNDTDQFILSWYSFAEDKYYKDIYPFKMTRFPPSDALGDDFYDDKFYLFSRLWLKKVFPFLIQKKISPIYIKLKYSGDLDLYTIERRQTYIVFFYTKVIVEELSVEKIEQLAKRYFKNTPFGAHEKERLKQSLAKKSETFIKQFNWNLNVDWLDELKSYIYITDLTHAELISTGNTMVQFNRRALPLKIELHETISPQASAIIDIHLDPEYLCPELEHHSPDVEIEFKVKVIDVIENKIQFFVKIASHEFEFKYIQSTTKIQAK